MRNIKNNILNAFSFKLNKKLLIFESDDWGSIRTSSLVALEKLRKLGVNFNQPGGIPFHENDCLESLDDINNLISVLSSHQDLECKNPIFTLLYVVANPDFDKIRSNNFQNYYYETADNSYQRIWGEDVLSEIINGINLGTLRTEFHGREHLNVPKWMSYLQRSDEHTLASFDENMWAFQPSNVNFDFCEAFYIDSYLLVNSYKDILSDGLDIFNHLFGKYPKYFVPPNGPFENVLNKTLNDKGIKLISSDFIHKSNLKSRFWNRQIRYLGKKNNFGQYYVKRNCFFEPTIYGKESIESCLNQIKLAFDNNLPAIISTHRLNYVSGLSLKNRDFGLSMLDNLLEKIKTEFPEVVFGTTQDLLKEFEN